MNTNTNTNTKLTPENASKYIGREILFTYNGATVKRTLLKVSESGKTIHVDHPETRNNLQLVSRRIFVVDDIADKVANDDIADAALKIPVLKRESAQEFIFPVAHNNEFIRSDDLKADFKFSEYEEYEKDEEEDGETYFMCTGKCNRVCHYEDTDGEGMCGTCQHKIQSKKRK